MNQKHYVSYWVQKVLAGWSEKGENFVRESMIFFKLNLVKVFREDEVTGCSKMSKKAEEGKGR